MLHRLAISIYSENVTFCDRYHQSNVELSVLQGRYACLRTPEKLDTIKVSVLYFTLTVTL